MILNSLNKILEELNSSDACFSYVQSMCKLQDDLFRKAETNIIQEAQEKQKVQYQKRVGQVQCPFKVGVVVLRRNMLQKQKEDIS